MKRICLILFTFTLVMQTSASENSEKAAVEQVVSQAIDAISNTGDLEIIESCFHPGFQLLTMKNNELRKSAIYNWKQAIKRHKAENKYPPNEKVTIEFDIVSVVGNAATAQFKYFKADRQTCTDFMSLYKFKDGWKIVSQTTFHHRD